MSDTAHVLIGTEEYYPGMDDVLAVFEDESDAERVLNELEAATDWRNDDDDAYERLKNKYDWLPKYDDERYLVVEKPFFGAGTPTNGGKEEP